MNYYAERVEEIRTLMRQNGWDTVVESGADPNSSKYEVAHRHRVEWLSEYNGERDRSFCCA